MKIIKVPSLNGLGKTKGCEKAPDAIIKELENFYSAESGKKAEFEIKGIKVDSGNIEKSIKIIKKEAKKYFSEKVIFLGGDHSISYPIISEFSKNKNSGLIVFDAHPDCMKPGKEPNHEEWLRAVIEHGFNPKNIILIAIRNSDPQEIDFMKKQGINVFSMKELSDNLEKACDIIMEQARKFDSLYLSLDIDALDPAFAPGTGYIEPGGLTSREFLYLIQRINLLKNLKAIDLVEVNPEKDLNNLTVKLAAKTITELM